jgi:hypothetical protein
MFGLLRATTDLKKPSTIESLPKRWASIRFVMAERLQIGRIGGAVQQERF